MKRSTGVTVIAILLIISGLGLLRENLYVFEPTRSPAETEALYDQMLARKQLSPEVRAEKREAFRRVLAQERSQGSQPARIAEALAGIAVALIGLIAGIGLLRTTPWGRTLTLWQAGLSIAMTLWTMMMFSSRQSELFEIARLMPRFVGQNEAEAERVLTARTFVGQLAMVTYLAGICWNSFVIWFFQRPKIKAQFQAARSQA